MATKTGGNITLQLMTTVAELEHAMGRQSEHMGKISERMTETSGHVVELGEEVAKLGERVTELGRRMTETSSDVSKLSSDMTNNTVQFGRVAKLLGALAVNTDSQHDYLEARVERLERKASGE